MYLDAANQEQTPPSEQIVEQKAVWTAIGSVAVPNGIRFKASDFAIEQLIPQHGWYLIEDVNDTSHLTEQLRNILTSIGVTSLLVLPLSTHQSRLGFLLAAYKNENKKFTQKQIRFFTTIAQQLVTALENLRLLDASQKRARREEIIREITLKIRNSVNVDDILKTTVTELGKVLGTSRGNIMLGIDAPGSQAQASLPAGNGSPSNGSDGSVDNTPKNNQTIGNRGNKNHGQ